MASCLVHVANLTVVARLRGAECRSPVFQTETQRNYSGEQPGMYHQRIFHLNSSSFALQAWWLTMLPSIKGTSCAPGSPGDAAFLRHEIHRACTGKYFNPQPANCLKDHNVLRHCCVGDRSDKIGHSANVLF